MPAIRPALTLCTAALLGAAVVVPATAAPRPAEVTLTPIGTVSTGAFDEGGSEIVAHDPIRQRAFSVNAKAGTVDVIDIADPAAPHKIGSLATPGANSVAVQGNLIAVAEQAVDKTQRGSVALFDARRLTLVKRLAVGALPDMVTITANGSHALVANEGEPDGYCPGMTDPEGSVSVIDLRGGAAKATVATADFRAWIGKEEALRADGVRIFGPGSNAAQDIEPEYITVDHTGKTAYVTLQENNAVAVVDIASATVTRIMPLGLKDHSVAGSGLDASDKDGKVNIATWPVKGMYLPDGIASFKAKAATYLVTANEGDARDWECFSEEQRIADVTLDPTVFPNAASLQGKKALGRLNISTTSPVNDRGEVTQLHAFGGRSVSVRDAATGALVWDSGDAFEQLTATARPELFNADHVENDSFDTRSDNKGPEPEGVDVGRIGGATYAFVGLERNSGIVAVDVTDPSAGRIAGYGINRDSAGDPEAGMAGDLGPEGVHFVPAGDSPNGRPLLLVGNEVSGTTTIWEVGTSR